MKKKLAILLTAVMAVNFSMAGTVFAVDAKKDTGAETTDEAEAEAVEEEMISEFDEEGADIKWSDIEPYLELLGLKGDFVTLDEVAVKMWVPEEVEEVELDEEDIEQGFIKRFRTKGGNRQVSVQYVDADGMTLEEYKEILEKEDGVEEISIDTLNDMEVLSYIMTEEDTAALAYATDAGYLLEFAFAPYSDEEFAEQYAMMMMSLQPE